MTRASLPFIAASVAFVSWMVGTLFDESARDAARALGDTRAESARLLETQLIVERLADLRQIVVDDRGDRCEVALADIPRWTEGDTPEVILGKDTQCIGRIQQVKTYCAMEDRGLRVRVDSARLYGETLERIADRLQDSGVAASAYVEVTQQLKAQAKAFNDAFEAFVGSFGTLMEQPATSAARNCPALSKFASSRADFRKSWTKQSAHFASLIADLPNLIQSADAQIESAYKKARTRASLAHWIAIAVAGLAAILALFEKISRNGH